MIKDLNNVRIFVHVVNRGSFTKAAKALFLPVSTVSRRVSQLEDELGVKLLHRTTRKLSLTELGALYYERCTTLLDGLDEANSVLSQSMQEPKGRVRVSVPVEHSITMDIVNEFVATYPEVCVEVEFTDKPPNIIQEGFDVSLEVGPLSNFSVIAHRVLTSYLVMIASPTYLQRVGKPKDPKALMEHQCIIFGSSVEKASWSVLVDGQVEKIALNGTLALNHLYAVLSAAQAGHGIALVPFISCRKLIQQGLLEVVLPHYRSPAVDIFITYPVNKFLPAAVNAFIRHARAHFKDVDQHIQAEWTKLLS